MTLPEIKEYFEKNKPKKKEVKLNNYTLITNVDTFIKSHIRALEMNSGNKLYVPYYNRLLDLINKLES